MTEQKRHWLKTGLLFGYPKCCVDAFVTLDHVMDSPRKLNGTGFIPCTNCNETKTEEEMIQEINKNRCREFKPFCPTRTEFNVKWQSGTNEGTVLVMAMDSHHAYQLASIALAAICKEKELTCLNVTVEPKGE